MHDLLVTLVLAGTALAIPAATAVAPTADQSTPAPAAERLTPADPAALPGSEARRAAAIEPAQLTDAEQLGQRLITRYVGARPTATVLAALREGRAGGVILFADNVPSAAQTKAATAQLRAAAAAGGQPPPLILIDQEGGTVKRIRSAPPHRSAQQLGSSSSPAQAARATGLSTGRALRALGINVNLAPVADVPSSASSFLGSRAFSRSPAVVANAACGFAAGLAQGKVAAALKHYPGLGRATGNTDLRAVTVGASEAALQRDLVAYRRCAAAVPLVMLSSASYPALGISRPAVVDARTYALLAGTGFAGLTLSDAIDTPALAAYARPDRAALLAGLDLVLYTAGEAGARAAHTRLLADLAAGRLAREDVGRAAARILAAKQRIVAGTLP